MWLRLLGCALVMSGCAEATRPTDHGTVDAPAQVDAPRPIDAPAATCTTNATCQTAMDLGSISGDTGSAMVTASGYQAAWFHVRVTEDDSSPLGVKLSATARLTSPATANYDVFVYVNTGSDVVECATPSGTLTTNGTTDEVRAAWGEGAIANGADDSRTVSIEVRPVTGACSPAQPWQLAVLGDT
jgi:hypothetical protein